MRAPRPVRGGPPGQHHPGTKPGLEPAKRTKSARTLLYTVRHAVVTWRGMEGAF